MKQFTSKTQKIGQIGENIAERFLKNKGFQVVERNFTVKLGEIDIVAKNSKGFRFVEVKTFAWDGVSRENGDFKPEDNVHPKKLERFARACDIYVSLHKIPESIPWQIDVVAIRYSEKAKKALVKHIECVW